MNVTIKRFGYPGTLIADYAHWVVLLRPEQPTLASLVLAARSEATAFSDLPPEAFAELGEVIGAVERALHATVRPQKINYLMLMMVDPNVHFHVLPRYEGTRTFEALEIADQGWPKLPVLAGGLTLSADQIERLVGWLRPNFAA